MTSDDLPHQVSSQSDLNEFRPKNGHYHATDKVHKHAQSRFIKEAQSRFIKEAQSRFIKEAQSRFIKEALRKGEHQHDAELQVRGRVHVIACDCL